MKLSQLTFQLDYKFYRECDETDRKREGESLSSERLTQSGNVKGCLT